MNQRQKEVLTSQLKDEKKIINDLKKIYNCLLYTSDAADE